MTDPLQPAIDWFERKGWSPFPFQLEVWRAYLNGESGLIHSATGSGKTYAAWLGPVLEWIAKPYEVKSKRGAKLRVLWVTPLRALAADTLESMQAPVREFGIPWTVEGRTGDTSQAIRQRQSEQMPTALVTTPESLSLMLSRPDCTESFSDLRLIIVDEWHELMSTKRGVQTELALAHIRSIAPSVRVWGMSATLGNLPDALQSLLGVGQEGHLVRGTAEKEVIIDTLLPENISKFPWAGHLGAQMVGPVLQALEESGTCLLFANTRSHAEIWYQEILLHRPEWADVVGIHHGSLDRETRDNVENGLRDGRLRAVVCTSSLDLGVDFTPVDRVLQLGSPKGVAKLLQRAGRSGHRPGVASRITGVPTHAFELVDMSAVRRAAHEGKIEAREELDKPLDVLAQHLITLACGEGFEPEETFREVKSAVSYAGLSREEWDWVLEFAASGGASLKAYPSYHRIVLEGGRYVVSGQDIARRHRLSIGTILSDAAINVQYVSGARLGTVEESFIARLNPGDKFMFAGRLLSFVRVKDMTALVRNAQGKSGTVPRWQGGRVPLSGELANAIRDQLDDARNGIVTSPEMEALLPVLEVQARLSAIPAADEFMVESFRDREGHHLFFYPFEGRLVHEGLAALFAYRISRLQGITFSMAANDYGFELLSDEPAPLSQAIGEGLLSSENLGEEILASLNSVEMARRQFREVARIAGLIFQGFPGAAKTNKQLQSSSGLLYDVFARFDPANMLLHQSYKEVLDKQLEKNRMARALDRLASSRRVVTEPPHATPLGFPILVDRLRDSLTTESVTERIERMAQRLEAESVV